MTEAKRFEPQHAHDVNLVLDQYAARESGIPYAEES
jgi:hypothetical protein